MRLLANLHRAGWHVRAVSGFAIGAGAVALATVTGLLLGREGHSPSIVMVFVPAILATATLAGLGASLLASVLSVLAYNFFFMEPLDAFGLDGLHDVVTVVVFLAVAIIASELATRLRQHANEASEREARSAAVAELANESAWANSLEDMGPRLARQIAKAMNAAAAIWLSDGENGFRLLAATDASLAVPRAGAGPDGALAAQFAVTGKTRGVVVAGPLDGLSAIELRAKRDLLQALADQAGTAIVRAQFTEEIEAARKLAETDRFRSALLNSISHDLRTPLASIIGSVTTLMTPDTDFSGPARQQLLETIQEEAFRLDRFVNNLLDMTRLESGVLAPKLDWTDLADVVGGAVRRLKRLAGGVCVELRLAPDLPLVLLDPVLTEQALVNLLDNAIRFSPPGGIIRVSAAKTDRDALTITVDDQGPGIPAAQRMSAFKKFHPVETGDRRRAGTGLGLSICRGFVEAQGGRVSIGDSALGGARFEITIPTSIGGATDREHARK